jgi:ferritin
MAMAAMLNNQMVYQIYSHYIYTSKSLVYPSIVWGHPQP